MIVSNRTGLIWRIVGIGVILVRIIVGIVVYVGRIVGVGIVTKGWIGVVETWIRIVDKNGIGVIEAGVWIIKTGVRCIEARIVCSARRRWRRSSIVAEEWLISDVWIRVI